MQFEKFFNVTQVLRAGIYFLCWQGEVVYIGQSKRLYARIYAHKHNYSSRRGGKAPSWLPVKGIIFDEVHVRPCLLEQLDYLERDYIRQFRPKHNVRHKEDPRDRTPLRATDPISLQIGRVNVTLNLAKPNGEPGVLRRI